MTEWWRMNSSPSLPLELYSGPPCYLAKFDCFVGVYVWCVLGIGWQVCEDTHVGICMLEPKNHLQCCSAGDAWFWDRFSLSRSWSFPTRPAASQHPLVSMSLSQAVATTPGCLGKCRKPNLEVFMAARQIFCQLSHLSGLKMIWYLSNLTPNSGNNKNKYIAERSTLVAGYLMDIKSIHILPDNRSLTGAPWITEIINLTNAILEKMLGSLENLKLGIDL